jgi:stress response protein SCP2
MAISLKKGQGVSLRKEENDLSQVTIGLGWDCEEPNQQRFEIVEQMVERKKGGLSGTLLGGTEMVCEKVRVPIEWDLDVVAFLCDAAGKVKNIGDVQNGKQTLVNGDIVFFNSLKHRSGQIWLTGDNRDGGGDGDDEQIVTNLNGMPDYIQKIVFVVQIYRGEPKGQSFGEVKNAFIRAVDKKGKEMARFDLSGGREFARYRSMIFAELVREGSGWKLNAIGEPFEYDSFVHILRDRYI